MTFSWPSKLRQLRWKTAILSGGLVLFITLCLLLPAWLARQREFMSSVNSSLSRAASLDADYKSKAIREGRMDRIDARSSLWKAGGIPLLLGLVDPQGETKAGDKGMPPLAAGAGKSLRQKAESTRQTALGAIGDFYVAIHPLWAGAKPAAGDQPIGYFVAAADQRKAAILLSHRGGFGLDTIALLVLIAAVAWGILQWALVRPITRLAAVEEASNPESGQIPIAPEAGLADDELGIVAKGRNRIARRLLETQSILRQTNALLERAEAKHRNLVEAIPDPVFHVDAEGSLVYLSDAARGRWGLDPDELCGPLGQFLEHVHPEDSPHVQEGMKAALRGESRGPIDFRLRTARIGERVIWLTAHYKSILDNRGRIRGLEGVFRDTTQGKDMEFELEDARLRLDALFELGAARRRNLPRRELFDLFTIQSAEILGMRHGMTAQFTGTTYRALGVCNLAEDVARATQPLADTPMSKIARAGRPLALLSEELWEPFGLDAPYVGAPILARDGETLGAICCWGETKNATEDNIRAVSLFAELLAPILAPASGPEATTVAAVDAGATKKLEEAMARLRRSCLETIFRLSTATEWRGQMDRQHVRRVAGYAGAIGEALGFDRERTEGLRLAAAMHDVGNAALADFVFDNPGPLSDEEREEIRRHALAGQEMLNESQDAILQLAARIARSHHEKWDGSGYPDGLKGEAIPVEACIVAVADAFDAVTTMRTYRLARSNDEAFALIRAGSGTHFSPRVVEAFLRSRERIEAIQERHKDEPVETESGSAPS